MITDKHEFHLALAKWTDGVKIVAVHPESHRSFKEKATDVFSSKGAILVWAEKYPYNIATVFIDDQELFDQISRLRPTFDLRLVVLEDTPVE